MIKVFSIDIPFVTTTAYKTALCDSIHLRVVQILRICSSPTQQSREAVYHIFQLTIIIIKLYDFSVKFSC